MAPTVDFFDNDGFLAIADLEGYAGYLGDWDLPGITALFEERVRTGDLAILYTGQEHSIGRFDVVTTPSAKKAEWEHTFHLRLTSGRLGFVTYTALTMVAQFEHHDLAGQTREIEEIASLEPGDYAVTFRRMKPRKGLLRRTVTFEPEKSSTWPAYELVVTPGTPTPPARFPGAEKLVP